MTLSAVTLQPSEDTWLSLTPKADLDEKEAPDWKRGGNLRNVNIYQVPPNTLSYSRWVGLIFPHLCIEKPSRGKIQ